MNIRIAQRKDLNQIVDIYNQAIAAGNRTADTIPVATSEKGTWFENHNPDKYPIYVAENKGDILGYLTLSPYRKGRHALRYTAEVSYYIHFNHHQKGIASALMQYAIDQCSVLQIKTLFAILLMTNNASIRLLEKFGFTKWGEMPGVADFNGVEVGQYYYGLRVG